MSLPCFALFPATWPLASNTWTCPLLFAFIFYISGLLFSLKCVIWSSLPWVSFTCLLLSGAFLTTLLLKSECISLWTLLFLISLASFIFSKELTTIWWTLVLLTYLLEWEVYFSLFCAALQARYSIMLAHSRYYLVNWKKYSEWEMLTHCNVWHDLHACTCAGMQQSDGRAQGESLTQLSQCIHEVWEKKGGKRMVRLQGESWLSWGSVFMWSLRKREAGDMSCQTQVLVDLQPTCV